MNTANTKEYELEFFKREGFVRKKCRYCGEYFWTLNREQEHCNDAPCVEYYFWDIDKKRRDLSVSEARRLFIEFFKNRGHDYVEPRPVVARWREDLYLTIASIVVFQPHVTKGIVPPPANPLVIVQPCIRLEDIDNVGVTFGRHLTSFEMGGHHAFNYPDKKVYWKEETVEYAFEFFTKELGIDPEMITFKESWWEGGGNAGPSFEVTVGGLELATLVFMQYDVVDGKYVELPLKIVDTGYGIERIAWFTQNVPTAFHAIYGNLVDRFVDMLEVEEPDERFLWEASRLAGRLDPESLESRERFYKELANRLGWSSKRVLLELEKTANVFALLDHTKTVALMLGDGIVPSNSGEGYLARLVIRRALRILRRMGSKTPLSSLVELQVDYWSRDYYPSMLKNKSYILDVVSYEEKRYQRALEGSIRIVESLVKRKKTLTVEDLIYLYDSHGIPPDIVRDVVSKRGISLDIPVNFYALVAKKHGASGSLRKTLEKPRLPYNIVEWARGLKPTRRLFHEDPYLREFKSRVVAYNGRYLVLDATAFYPTGGGQLHDKGVIEACGDKYNVVGVEKIGDVIVHVLDKEFRHCDNIVGRIDWARRYKLMRHHTAVHVVLGAARRVLGDHVWQAGAEKTPEKARLDITHYKSLSYSDIRSIEELANQAIIDAIPVEIEIVGRNEAERKYGFRIYQGGVPLASEIRIVRIGEWDTEACFGTHVKNTSEIGGIKITNATKLQDGVIRLELVAGTELVRYSNELEEVINKVSKMVASSRENVVDKVARIMEEYKSLRKKNSELEKYIISQLVEKALKTGIDVGGIRLYIIRNPIISIDGIRELLRTLTSRDPSSIGAVIKDDKNQRIVELSAGSSSNVDLRKIASIMRTRGYKGGGKRDHIMLVSSRKLEEIVDDLLSVFSSNPQGS